MSPQVQAAWVRGLVLTLVIALATAGEAAVAKLLTGDDTRTVVIAALGALCNTVLARVGEGKLDANRATMLRKQLARGEKPTALLPSDIAYDHIVRSPPPK